ncbi:MAG TPA: hypothetical protein VGK19_07720 [Capsulimonadaceae bacterium]|jgi:hypothetical protein
MKQAATAILCTFVLVIGLSSVTASPFASRKGYTLDFPAGWIVTPGTGDTDVVFTAPRYKPAPKVVTTLVPPSITVAVGTAAVGASTGDALKAARESMVALYKAQVPTFNLIDSGSAQLGELYGYYITGSYTPVGAQDAIEFRRVYAVRGLVSYTMTSAALLKEFDAVEPKFAATEGSLGFAEFDSHAFTSPYGFQLTVPEGWMATGGDLPTMAKLIDLDTTENTANILITSRPGLPLNVDIDRVVALKDEWNMKYRAQPDYAPVDQGVMTIGGEKAFFAIWTQTGGSPQRRLRQWHIMLPRNGVLIELIATYVDSEHRRYDTLIRDTVRSWTWCAPESAPPSAKDDKSSPAITPPAK